MDPTAYSATSPASAFVRGLTLVCGADVPGRLGIRLGMPLTGTTWIGADAGGVSAYGDGTVDCIVALEGLDDASDPVQTLRAWRRVLKEGGTLVLGCAAPAAGFMLSLARLVGGFECISDAPSTAGADVVLARQRIAEIRSPLAVLGPTLAAAAGATPACRAELLFQFGTVLLQAGETALARGCFEQMLRQEPSSPEGHFGLGMTLGVEQRWKDALCELECARRLDPANAEASRWADLARGHLCDQPPRVLPSTPAKGTPAMETAAKWSPAPALPRAGAGACMPL